MRVKAFRDLTLRGRGGRLRPYALRLLRDAYCIRGATLHQITAASNVVFRANRPRKPPLVLRLTSPKSCHGPAEIRSELAWIEALSSETSIGVPRPVPLRGGGYVADVTAPGIPGTWHGALFHWVPGRMLAERRTRSNTAAHGHLSATLHRHATAFAPPAWFRIRRYDDVFAYSDPAFAPSEPIVLFNRLPNALMPPSRRAVFERVCARVRAFIREVHDRGTPQVIHNDLHIWNVKIARGTTYALDFEDLLWGFPAQDLATTLYYYRYEKDYPALLDAFRQGYERVQAWPIQRAEQLETLIAGRSLLLANYVAASDDAEDRAFAPEYLRRTEERLRRHEEGMG
jgi:Ser/Thr protein kinase RdoA (MazF antagonist)